MATFESVMVPLKSLELEPVFKKAVSEFPAMVLTGPRQSGKTTILQHLFGGHCHYVSLEPPDVRASAVEDPRTFRQVDDLSQFQNFLRALAARSAQLLNLTDVARDLGVAVNTTKAWLSVMEATYQVIVLRPYFANIGKRLVKTPKVYFSDVGTLCYLTGLKDPEHAASGPMGGAIMVRCSPKSSRPLCIVVSTRKSTSGEPSPEQRWISWWIRAGSLYPSR